MKALLVIVFAFGGYKQGGGLEVEVHRLRSETECMAVRSAVLGQSSALLNIIKTYGVVSAECVSSETSE